MEQKFTQRKKEKKHLKEAVDAAFKAWIENIDDTFYVLGSAVGPHPYPTIVKDFQKSYQPRSKTSNPRKKKVVYLT